MLIGSYTQLVFFRPLLSLSDKRWSGEEKRRAQRVPVVKYAQETFFAAGINFNAFAGLFIADVRERNC